MDAGTQLGVWDRFVGGKKEGFRGALSRAYGCGEDAGGSLQVGHPIGWVRGPCLALWLVLNRKLVKT